MEIITANNLVIRLDGVDSTFRVRLRSESQKDGIELVYVSLQVDRPLSPPQFKLMWEQPVIDIQAFWHPGAGRNKRYEPDWGTGFSTRATSLAPVGSLFNVDGENRLTFAVSDSLNPLEIRVGVNEETAMLHCSVTFFVEPSAPITDYEAVLRVDTRSVQYFEALNDVQGWWAKFPGYEPASVPALAKLPMYSTWYSFHQILNSADVEDQCRRAKMLGCEAVIIDDGWQTADNQRGYAYCGDWRVAVDKIPDMRKHIDVLHDIGMAVILWYNIAFVGMKSSAWRKFQNKLLGTVEELGAGVLDPRFPEVREYIITTYENAVRDWNLDGLKIDFVDSFRIESDRDLRFGEGRDFESVPAAVDTLLSEVINRLRAIKPEILIEFRQSYVGPLMRHYGNMFRASDCPNDAITNRVRTIDIRLLCGFTAAHADMVMWHPDEPVESAALQLINILFSVPQISVRLEKIPQSHVEMVRFWLGFWLQNRDVLVDGFLAPHQPELLYPVVESWNMHKHLVVFYQDSVVQIGNRPGVSQRIVVNGTKRNRVVIDATDDLGEFHIQARDCCGTVIRESTICLSKGLHVIGVPPSGIATLTDCQLHP